MKSSLILLALVINLTGGAYLVQSKADSRVQQERQANSAKTDPMTKAAVAFLKTLDDNQHKKAVFPFQVDERFVWNFVPMVRKGLPLKEMNEKQQKLALGMLKTGLSEVGYDKAQSIIELEDVLTVLENREPGNSWRNPELYYVAFFGDPAGKDPWGWRFEGHHLSLNYTSVNRTLSVTPAFFGTNPHKIPIGENKGSRILAKEEDLGRALLHSFSAEQAKKAIISSMPYPDIVTGTAAKAILDKMEGLPAADMNPEQKQSLTHLIFVYLDNMKPDIAEREWKRIQEKGFDKVYFAWAGGTEVGEKHYYRIHGPGFLIEYDNVQNEGNHVHTILRDLENDFGEDLLRKHYQEHDH